MTELVQWAAFSNQRRTIIAVDMHIEDNGDACYHMNLVDDLSFATLDDALAAGKLAKEQYEASGLPFTRVATQDDPIPFVLTDAEWREVQGDAG